ncbi:hypothetical protein MOMA_01670 [Moraxella macacae 0408225]|uniref:DUF4442 domain-containing protein n=1 Tax=Moraxella macacae 0408225 TaxID=1230338 RepID=L2F7T3_9GAMM|nr:DUF4442 domain-containing protein [Moraxella macacae]ELA09077.1 hypothetical protein MOMA_01670 [Moraxella macacae 0408225]
MSFVKNLTKIAGEKLNLWQKPRLLAKLFGLYAPYLGAGVRVDNIDFANHRISVSMPLTKFNQNIVGTQFGGSLYSMTDPFFMALLMNALGNEYVVWDKSASIDFIKPGTTKVTADIWVSCEEIATIKELTKDGNAVFRDYVVAIKDEHGDIVAKVDKKLYIRLRKFSKSKDINPRF